ncbi:MAG: transposase [Deltaproteobacteria bacterium]|nr:transposase [Deltaproteobacteria bacterium]
MIDAGIGMVFNMLEYKAEEADTRLRKVDPTHTIEECAVCGTFVVKELSTRVHRCPNCGFTTDRDHNAALNILFRALEKAPGPERIGCGEGRWFFDEAGHHNHTALAVGYR